MIIQILFQLGGADDIREQQSEQTNAVLPAKQIDLRALGQNGV